MTRPEEFSSRTKWAALALLVLFGCTLLLAAAEGVVRLRQWTKHGTASSFEELYRFDERIRLRVPVPGVKIGNITINSLGYRGPEIPVQKPPGRIRIAFLGASTTFCAEASGNAAAWPHQVVEKLRARFPRAEFDYVNGAVPGFTVRSSLKNLQHRIAPLEPDLIVIYHATNDLSQEVRRLAAEQGYTKDAPPEARGWLARNLRLWDLVQKNLKVIKARRGAETGEGRVRLTPKSLGQDFRQSMDELLEAAARNDRRVAVATFSTRLRPEQSEQDKKQAAVSALVYMPWMSLDGLLAGYARYNEIIREVARSRGALLVEGENRIPADAKHFADSVHFTDAGSRAMAERVFAALAADPRLAALAAERAGSGNVAVLR